MSGSKNSYINRQMYEAGINPCIKSINGGFISLKTASTLTLFLGIFFITFFSLNQGSFSTLMAFLVFGILGFVLATRAGATASRIFTLVYGVSVSSAVILYFIYVTRYGSPYIGGGSDDLAYDQYAKIVAKSLWHFDAEEIGRLIDFPYHNSKGYIYLVSLLVRFGDLLDGYNTMISRLFNCSLLGLIATITYSISKQIGMLPKQAKIAALWVGLFPMMVFAAIHTFRDILITVILLMGLKLALKVSACRDWLMPLLFSAFFLLLFAIMAQLRFLYIIALSAMLVTAWFSKLWPEKRMRYLSIVILIIPIILAAFLISSMDLKILLTLESQLDGTNNVLKNAIDRGSEDGLAARLFSLPPPFVYVARFAYALVSPLPIYYAKIEWNLLGLGALAQFFFATFIFFGIKLTYRNLWLLPMLSGFLILFFGYVMGSFTFRHITAFVPFSVMYGVIGYSHYRQYRKLIFGTCFLIIAVAGIAYSYLKF